jgi:probable rRNA maturation factor
MSKPRAGRRAPRLRLTVTRRPGAPSRPGRAALARLLNHAWRLARRPQFPDARALAVDVLVLDDAEIARLNQAHRHEAGPTDVLAFPMGEPDLERRAFLLGEIAVSFETAAREAAARGLRREEELARYIVHGFLHLLGYEDGTNAQRRALERVQERALAVR